MANRLDPSSRQAAALGLRAVFGARQRWMVLALFGLLVVLRIPHAWTHGRFLAEEASVFLAYAWHRPWFDALFRPFAGYWNLAANATTLIVARLVQGGIVPLERAPYLTMLTALAVQMMPAVLILTGRASWIATRVAVVAALLIIVTAPGTEEVFLNVLHIQFHLALCTALILALDVPSRRIGQIGYTVLLFLAPLCGPGAIIVLPLIALRGLIDHDRGRLPQFAAAAIGAAFQMLLFYGHNPMRGHLIDPGTISTILLTRLLAMPMLGFAKANYIAHAIYHSQLANSTGWWWAAAISIILFGGLVVLATRRRDGAIWLLLSSLSIGVVSFGFGVIVSDRSDLFSVGAGERYNFLPLVLFGLAMLALTMRQEPRTRYVYGSFCVLMVFTGIYRYPRTIDEIAQGPSWPAEVALWRLDHRHPLAVWPVPWTADLSDRNHPCTPVGSDTSRSTDPLYCESGWVAANSAHPPIPKSR